MKWNYNWWRDCKNATAEGIKNSTIIVKTLMTTIRFSFYFAQLAEIMKITKQKNVSVIEKQIEDECTMELSFPKEEEEKLRKQLDKISGLRFL